MLALLLLACAPTDDTGGAPSMVLLSPADGDVVCGSPLVVETDVENFDLTNASEELAPEGSGHLHVYLNGQLEAQTGEETAEITDVGEGEKQLRVELGYANHEPLVPYVGTTIYITISSEACS